MQRILIDVVGALATLLAASVAQAADIKVVTEESRQNGRIEIPAVIEVTGKLDDTDGAVFDGRTAGIIRAIVYLHSMGGSALGGVQLGLTIRARDFFTAVANHQFCYSACALAWLGGRKRFLGIPASVGFHGPFDKAGKRGEAADAAVGAYIKALGFSGATAAKLLAPGPTDLVFVRDQIDGKPLGIELTRIQIPVYVPLP